MVFKVPLINNVTIPANTVFIFRLLLLCSNQYIFLVSCHIQFGIYNSVL
jgi:hypothetical protein